MEMNASKLSMQACVSFFFASSIPSSGKQQMSKQTVHPIIIASQVREFIHSSTQFNTIYKMQSNAMVNGLDRDSNLITLCSTANHHINIHYANGLSMMT